jgi:ubiquitin C-terminal hydrolase
LQQNKITKSDADSRGDVYGSAPLGGMGKKKRHSSRRANPKSKPTSKDRKSSSLSLSNDGPCIRGITNLGNTCFFNSSLQALAAATEKTDTKLDNEDPVNWTGGDEGKEDEESLSRLKVYSQFAEVMKMLGMNSQKILNPSQLLTALSTKVHQFNNRRQHDSHELIIHLISSVLEEFEKREIKRHQLLSLFHGNLVGIVQCQECQYRSCSINKFVDISLEIPGSRHLFRYPARQPASSLPTRVTRSKKREAETQKLEVVAEQKEESTQEGTASDPPDAPDGTEEEVIGEPPDSTQEEPSNIHSEDLTKEASQQLLGEELGEKETLLQILEPADDVSSVSSSSSGVISLFDCLRQYTSRETLTVESGEGYNCPQCSKINTSCGVVIKKRSASKRLLLLDMPLLLILHLKRLLPGGKCSSFISFPLKMTFESFIGLRSPESPLSLDPNSTQSVSPNYLLRAVIVHIGSGGGGHYIAYVYRHEQWFFTSDAATRKAAESEVLQSQAYILMYRRASADASSGDTEVMQEVTESLDSLNLSSSSAPLAESQGDEGTEDTDHEEEESAEEEEKEEEDR